MTEHEWDKLLRIQTTGRDASISDTFRYPYEPTAYKVLERLANEGIIGKKNTVLDYGCGKGRVSLFLSYQVKCKSIGIEYNEFLYERAISNKQQAVSGSRVDFECVDAKEYELSPYIDRVFFFNPFSVEILKTVLKRIYDSYYDSPREILLLFYYPQDEYIAALMQEPWLEFLDEIDCRDLFDGKDSRERIVIFSVG